MNNYYTGKTVDDAIEAGLKALGIEKDQAEITVVEEASKGFLGLGSRPAKVLVTKKMNDEDRTVAFLEGLFDVLKVAVAIEVKKGEDERIVIDLMTANSSALIGYRGEVLDSIQTLAGAVYNSGKEDYSRVMVDCENYREKREKTLISLANKLANKAVKTGRKVTLEPMNPFERRIIHAALTDFAGVKTESEGKEPNRYVVIIPDGYDPTKEKQHFGKKGGFDGKKGGFDKRGGKGGRGDRKFDNSGSAPRKESKKDKPFGMGTFLGNSMKDKD